jgi:hypothetical protein
LSPVTVPYTICVRVVPALLLAGLLVTCGRGPVTVRARLTLHGEPVAGREVLALPYDPGRLLDSLGATTGAAHPDFPALEAELRAFRERPPAPDDTLAVAWRATRDSVADLADSLRASDRRSAGYAEAYERFRRLYGRLMQRSAARDRARRRTSDVMRDLALRAGRAADSLRAWEDAGYAGFDSAAAGAIRASGRQPMAVMSDAQGWVELTLPRGAWWLTVDLPHPDNPFLEYRWIVPVTVSAFPFHVPLDDITAREVWRH